MDKITILWWDGNQLTSHLIQRNILVNVLVTYLTTLRMQYECQGWEGVVTPEEAAEHVAEEMFLVTDGKGWLAWDMVQPWFLTTPLVTEEFYVGMEIDTAVAILKELAVRYGCKRVMVGTRAAPHGRHIGLAKVYGGLGLSISTIELTLEVDNEQSSEEGQEGSE